MNGHEQGRGEVCPHGMSRGECRNCIAHAELERRLESDDLGRFVSESSDLDHEDATRLIESGKARIVGEHIERFSGLDLDNDAARKLIDGGAGEFIAEKISKFHDLDQKTAEMLILHGYGAAVYKNLRAFEGLDAELKENLRKHYGSL